MNPEVKALWIEALRSGRFKKAKGKLTRVSQSGKTKGQKIGHCCLGVLTELYQEAHPDAKLKELVRDGVCGYADDSPSYGPQHYEDAVLPQRVRDWAGLNEEGSFSRMRTLIDMNDHGVYRKNGEPPKRANSFREIANEIQRTL